jgi:hypothetical protein
MLEAVNFGGEDDDARREPMCFECADGAPCSHARVQGLARDESSVRPVLSEFGEFGFAKEERPVVHRTPEELGLPAVIPDRPAPRPASTWTDGNWEPGLMPRPGLRRDRPQTGRTIGARAMRTEATFERKREADMPTGKYGYKTPDEIREKILAEPPGIPARVIAERYGVGESTVWALRLRAGIAGAKRGRPMGQGGKAARRVRTRAPTANQNAEGRVALIPVNPEPSGSAAALLGALEKLDGQGERVRVELELTQAEIGRLFSGLGPAQRTAFLSAGLRAALLG